MSDRLAILEESFVPATEQILDLSEKDRAKLMSLGYLSSGNPARNDPELQDTEVLRDIMDMLPLLAKFDKARLLISEGKLERSILSFSGDRLGDEWFSRCQRRIARILCRTSGSCEVSSPVVYDNRSISNRRETDSLRLMRLSLLFSNLSEIGCVILFLRVIYSSIQLLLEDLHIVSSNSGLSPYLQ
jgi:hypothetical protein